MKVIFYWGPIGTGFLAALVVGIGRSMLRLPPDPSGIGWGGRILFFLAFSIFDGTAIGVGLASPLISQEAGQRWIDSIGEATLVAHILLAPLVAVLILVSLARVLDKTIEET